MDAIQILEVPDRMPGSSALVNRRLTQYLARRAAGEPPRAPVASNVTFRPMTDEERAAREERLRSRNPEKREPAYAYRRSAVEAYRPNGTAAPAEVAQPEVAPQVKSKWPHPKRRHRSKAHLNRVSNTYHAKRGPRRMRRSQRPTKVDLNRDLNGMIRKRLGV